jgi:hypothetical protein
MVEVGEAVFLGGTAIFLLPELHQWEIEDDQIT